MPPDTMAVSVAPEASLGPRDCSPQENWGSSAACVPPHAAPSAEAVEAATAPQPVDQRAVETWSQLLGQMGARLQLVLHPVPHFKQLFSWDCGLACALMALRAVGLHHCDYTQLRQLCPTTSIWTIDLAHLLRRFGLDVTFFTITLGPNPAYYNESFYLAHMQEDERRVSQLFHDARAAGIYLGQRSVCWQELASHLMAGSALVLVLVDKRKLDPWLMAADLCLPYALCGMDPGYTGHYILLVGWDGAAGQFLVHDPSGDGPGEVRVTPAALDAARSAFGTDEDVLLVRHATLAHTALVVPQPCALPAQQQQQPEQQHEERIGGCDRQLQLQAQQQGCGGCCPLQLEALYRCALGPGCALQQQQQQWHTAAGPQQQRHVQQQGSMAVGGAQEQQLSQQHQWELVGLQRLAAGGSICAGGGLARPELLLLAPSQEPLPNNVWWASGGVQPGAWPQADPLPHDQQATDSMGQQALDAHWTQGQLQQVTANASQLLQQRQQQLGQPAGQLSAGSDAQVELSSQPEAMVTEVEIEGQQPCEPVDRQPVETGEGLIVLEQQQTVTGDACKGENGQGAWPSKQGNATVQASTASAPASSWTQFWYWAPTWSYAAQQSTAHAVNTGRSSTSSSSSSNTGGDSSSTSSCQGDSQSSSSSCDSELRDSCTVEEQGMDGSGATQLAESSLQPPEMAMPMQAQVV